MANLGVVPVDLGSNIGRVRVLINDTNASNVTGTTGEYLYFSDQEIESILTMYSNNPKAAAAQALETIASSQVLLLKSWSSDDLTVRGDAIAEALRKLADQLRKEAISDDSNDFYDLIQTIDADDPAETWWN